MSQINYRSAVLRTANLDVVTYADSLVLGALGLAGEVGEVVELIKKQAFHGKPIDKDKLINEMGDVRWYLEYLAAVIDTSMEEIEKRNVEKLRARFPEGFTHKAANAKADEVTA